MMLGAGLASVSNDPVTHNTLSAEQKLYGPLQVTTAVTDFGQTTSSESISAGLRSIGRPFGALNPEKVVHNLCGATSSAGRPCSAPRPPKSHAAIDLQRGPAQFALRLVGVDHEQE
jgi:hypothetical protein